MIKKRAKSIAYTLAMSVSLSNVIAIAPVNAIEKNENDILKSSEVSGYNLEDITTYIDEENYTVIDVSQFGADPSGRMDSASAIIEAIKYAKTIQGPKRIYFPEGEYHIWPEKTEKRELYISNTVGTNQAYKKKSIGILIEDMKDVLVDGGGSQFIYHGFQTAFASIRSENVKFENFAFDYVNPKVVDVTVEEVGVEDGKGYRTIYIPETYNYKISNNGIDWYGEESPVTGVPYWSGRNSFNYTQYYDYTTGETRRGSNPLFSNVSSITDLGNNRIQIKYNNATKPSDLGRSYQMRETTRDTAGTFFWESKDVVVKDVDVNYLHGFGFVGQFTENVTVDGVDFRVRSGSGRTTASFADYIQMSGIKGKVKITNTSFSNPHDDPINVHGTYLEVKERIAPNKVKVRYMHNETAGFPQFYVGDDVEFFTKTTMLPVDGSQAKVVEVDGPSGTSSDKNLTDIIITLDKDLPEEIVAGSTHVVENITYTPEVEITNNNFIETPTRGILVTTRKPVLIENNYFDGMGMSSIFISSDAHQWYESGPTNNVTIKNNIFDRSAGPVIDFGPTNQVYNENNPVHNNIVIEDNIFNINNTTVLKGKSVGNLEFKNNTINRYNPNAKVNLEGEDKALNIGDTAKVTATSTGTALGTQLFEFNGSNNIKIENNKYDNGLNLRVNTSAMSNPANNITFVNDDLKINENNNINPGGVVKYYSSNEEVAIVDGEGNVTAVGEGIATVTAYSEAQSKAYKSNSVTFNVGGVEGEVSKEERFLDAESALEYLNVTGIEGMPEFEEGKFYYMPNGSTESTEMHLDIKAKSNKAKLRILVDGKIIAETEGNTYTGTIPLSAGGNGVQIYSIAEDGGTTMYRVAAIRRENNDTSLKDLSINGETINGFNPENTSYIHRVSEEVESINISSIKNYDKSRMLITSNGKIYGESEGEIPLKSGVNDIYVKVQSENYAVDNYYKISVIRSDKSNSSLLSLETPNNRLDSAFNPNEKEYTITTSKQLFELNAVSQEVGASIEVKINDKVFKGNGEVKASTNLISGINTARIKVTSEDGKNITEYIISINAIEKVYISDLDWEGTSSVGWGSFMRDKSPSGGVISLIKDGEPTQFEKGIGAHAQSTLIYDIEGKGYETFEAYAGTDYSQFGSQYGHVTYKVYIDGVERFNSGELSPRSEAAYINLDVSGAKEIKLVADKGANDYNDHAVWADAKFKKSFEEEVAPESDASLSGIELSNGLKLSPNFDSKIKNYTVDAGSDRGGISIKANATREESKVSIIANGIETDYDNVAERPIYLDKNQNEVKVKVTSKDGTISEYNIIFNKQVLLNSNWKVERPLDGYIKVPTDGSDSVTIETATEGGMWATGESVENIILTDVIEDDFNITVKMDGTTETSYEEAGIIIYKDVNNYTAIQRKHAGGNPNIMLVNEINGAATENSNIGNPSGGSIYLKLEKVGSKITGYYSQDEMNWTKVYEVNNSSLTSGYKVGVIATGSTARTPFTFTNFKVNNENVKFTSTLTEVPEDFIVDSKEIEVTTDLNNLPKLPEEVLVKYLSGEGMEKVTWDEVSLEQVSKVGEFIVEGKIEGTIVKAKALVKVIDDPSEEIVVDKVSGLAANNVKNNSIDIIWNKPSSTVGLEEYVIYKDGKILDRVPANETKYTISELRSNTIYGIKVTTKYSNGEESKPVSINCRTIK
ncbi:NPCBM/NEW2 domain-containing protein [Clostridium sp.]|uniref:NPCBM/NEW2 domain-containing protein n=1 Tax=Clostridium sp. TaxID=1506 RepID=UPI003F30323F